MPESASKAVFLRYASQDAEASRRRCEALRSSDVQVWFDQSELSGGDAREYLRLEWKLRISARTSSTGSLRLFCRRCPGTRRRTGLRDK